MRLSAPWWRRWLVLALASALMGGVLLVAPADARDKVLKVDVCHQTGNGSFRLINVSGNALDGHVGHGDALPGDEVPGMPGFSFDEQCVPVQAGVVVARATTYGGALVAELVDVEPFGYNSNGEDYVRLGSFPSDFNGGTGTYSVTRLDVAWWFGYPGFAYAEGPAGDFLWENSGSYESFAMNGGGGYSTFADWLADCGSRCKDRIGIDGGVGAPSTVHLEASVQDPSDNDFINISVP